MLARPIRTTAFAVLLAASAVTVPARPAGAGTSIRAAIDPSTRASMRAAYKQGLEPAFQVPVGWTGSTQTCTAGTPSAAAQEATLTAVNWFRELAGLAPVTFDATLSARSQAAALMMEAQNNLSHSPGTSWACYTADGAQAAGASNLALGASGAGAVRLYMVDPGGSNTAAGHRRWILYPPQQVMGSGSTSRANSLYVFGTHDGSRTGPDWVSWPTPGYFPVQLEPQGRWSLSASDGATNFSAATVTVMRGTTSLPVTVHPVQNGYGRPTLVWQVDPGYGAGRPDQRYDVTVSGIVRGGATVSRSYSVTLFDAGIDADQTISFPALADRTYGDPAATLSATASSGLPVTFTSATPAVCQTSGTRGATLTLVAAGACSVDADQAGDEIRNPAPTVTRTFQVAKRPLTVTAQDATRPPGAANPAFTVSYAGFAPGETLATSGVTGAPSCTTPATADSPPGTYAITCTVGTLASGRYSFGFVAGTLTVADDYAPLVPARLLDTRPGRVTTDGLAAGGGPVDGVLDLVVAGRGGVPATGASAVVLNVTAVAPAGSSFVTVWPTGVARPNASNLNLTAGVTTANLAVVPVGAGGKVSLFTGTATHLLADVVGWFPAGDGFGALVPARLLDTRPGRTTVDGVAVGGGPVPGGAVLELPVLGRGGVPPSGVGAVVLNVAAVSPAGSSFVTVWPTGVPRPNASSLNVRAGVTVANLVVVPVGAGGKVRLFTGTGTHLLADVVGWFPADGTYGPLVPARLLDTRPGRTTVDGLAAGGGTRPAGSTLELSVLGRGGVPPSGVTAVVLNVTAVTPASGSFVTVWPAGVPRPNASNLNFATGVTTANLVFVPVGAGGKVSLFTGASTHLLADVVGWFGPPPT